MRGPIPKSAGVVEGDIGECRGEELYVPYNVAGPHLVRTSIWVKHLVHKLNELGWTLTNILGSKFEFGLD